MKNFYNDETLGIKNEDAPVNATGAAVAGTGDDASTVVVKKKKKTMYDGRTREARSFLKRMETLRAKRESKLAKKVQENTDNFGVEYLLAEDNVEILKNIVKNKQNNKRETFETVVILLQHFVRVQVLSLAANGACPCGATNNLAKILDQHFVFRCFGFNNLMDFRNR